MARTEPGSARRPGMLGELVRATRPRQWSKNLLVFAAPLLSGRFAESDVLGNATIAFVSFTLAASGIYLVNDVRDVASDRAHPTKQRRPVAAGTLEARTAARVGALLAVAALLVALVSGPALVAVVAILTWVPCCNCLRSRTSCHRDRHHRGGSSVAHRWRAAAGLAPSQWSLLRHWLLSRPSGSGYAENLLLERAGLCRVCRSALYSSLVLLIRVDGPGRLCLS